MANPLVTICIPTRNRVAALQRSVKSILNQDYAPIEIIISDNGSNDGTEAFCRELARVDRRVRYVRQPRNIGLHGNHNFCLGAGAGEFLCLFHDHDDHDPAIVSTYVAFLLDHPDVGLVCSDWELIDEAGSRLGVRDRTVEPVTPGLEYIERTIRSGRSSIGIPGTMIRRSALGSIRFVNEAPVGFGDFPVWFEVAETWNVGHVSRRLWRCTQSPRSQSARTIMSMTHDYYENVTRYCDAHVKRWPEHSERVARWRSSITRYLFWALAYEMGLYFRTKGSGQETAGAAKRGTDPGDGAATLFEMLGYRLGPEEFQAALMQLRSYRTGSLQNVAFLLINGLIRLRWTWPLAWSTRHHARLRNVLGLG